MKRATILASTVTLLIATAYPIEVYAQGPPPPGVPAPTQVFSGGGTGSTVIGSVTGTGSVTLNGPNTGSVLPSANAALPLNFARSKGSDLTPSYDVTKHLASDYACTTPSNCFASMMQAYCDWVAAGDQNWHVQIPNSLSGQKVQTGGSVTCTQTGATVYRQMLLLPKVVAGGRPAKYIVFDSETPLPEGHTVCSGDIDISNASTPATGDISTWWTGTNYGCNPDRDSMWVFEGNWNPGNAGMIVQVAAYDPATGTGTSNVIFKNVELRPIPGNTAAFVGVNTNQDAIGSAPTLTTQMAKGIHFINYYAHGDAKAWCGHSAPGVPVGITPCTSSVDSGGPGSNAVSSMFTMPDCIDCSLTYGHAEWVIRLGSEDHIVTIPRSPGPFKVAQNYLSGGSSAVFLGGESIQDPIAGIQDVQITSNFLTVDKSWLGLSYGGLGLTLKNRIELKVGQRLLITGNILRGQDTSGGQDGQLIGLTPRNCANGVFCDNYVPLQDITIQYNLGSDALTVIESAASSSYSGGNGGGVTPPADHWTIDQNLFYNIGSAFYDQHKAISFPYFTRPTPGGGTFVCPIGTQTAGIVTLTCDTSVIGLRQLQIRVGDSVIITNCTPSNWNFPQVSTNIWEFAPGAIAVSGTTPAGNTLVYANPFATGSTSTGCVVQASGGPYHQVVTHNTIVMQTDAFPSGTGASGTNIRTISGTGSIAGGLATVPISGVPVAVPFTASVNVVGANVTAYNCALCPVTATGTSPNTVTYQLPGATNINLDDTLTGWTNCIKPSCDPGGIGIPTSTAQTLNNISPAYDGKSMKITLSGPANTNSLWYNSQGANNTMTAFHADARVYIASLTGMQAIEYDNYQFRNPDRFMWGSECVIGGVWDIWNGLTQSWVHTAIPCTFTAQTWHRIAWDGHRILGDVSCAGRACMYYDKLTVDGTAYTGFTAQPSDPLPAGWSDSSGTQYQLDINSSGGTVTEYLDQVSFRQTSPATSDALTTGTIQQPPNNGRIFSGSVVNINTDTGCTGAGPNNPVAITAWSRAAGVLTASGTFPKATWPTATGATQIIAEVTGSGTANGFFYYIGALGLVGVNYTSAQWSQPGMPDETGSTFGTVAQMGTCPGSMFAKSNVYQDNLIVTDDGGGLSCPATPSAGWTGWAVAAGANVEGCPSGTGNANCSENHLDAITSTVNYNDFPGRCGAKYMEMGGANAGNICAPGTTCTLTFPATTACSGPTATAACVGMKSMMNGVPFDADNPDPSQYVLNSTSVYKNAGHDGTDLGIGTYTGIDSHIHSHLYVCASFCGVNSGPYPD